MIIGIDGNEANTTKRVGINEYAFQLLTCLEKLPEAKQHEFIIYLKDEPLSTLPKERAGWRYKVLKGGGLWILKTLMPHLLLSKNKPDIFFSPSHYAPPILTIPSVVSITDLGYLSKIEQFRKYDYLQLKYWGALSMLRAKKIIAISESTKADIAKHYPKLKDKVEVTHLAYSKDIFKKNISPQEISRVKKKFQITKPYILFLSTLKPSKNIEGLIEAFSLLENKNDLQLVIAGKKGWLYESIYNKVQFLGLEDQVIFTDFVDENDKPGLVAGAQVFAAPSFWEGFGIHVLEAMAVGTPVVVSQEGSLSEVVGQAGVYVDPKNPASIALGLAKALKERNELIKKGLAQSKKFDWEKTAKLTFKILRSVVN